MDVNTLEPMRAQGLTDHDIEEVAVICSLFNVIVRLADTLDFDVPPEAYFDKMAPMMLKGGYK